MTIQDAEILVARQIGVGGPDFDGSAAAVNNLAVDDKQALTTALLKYVRQNPGDFTKQQVAAANAAPHDASGQLTLRDYTVSDFISDSAKGAAEGANDVLLKPLASVGYGISNSFSLVGTLLPVLVVAAIVVFGWPYIRKAFGK